MDIQGFIPANGASLRDVSVITREPVATVTQTQTVHPDSIWRPLGGEFDQGRAMRLLSSARNPDEAGQQGDAGPGRPSTDTGDGFSFQDTARMVRLALTGGARHRPDCAQGLAPPGPPRTSTNAVVETRGTTQGLRALPPPARPRRSRPLAL